METVLRARNTRKVRNIWGLKTPPSSSPFVLGGDVISMTMVIYLGWKMTKQTDITLAKLTSSDWRLISIILYLLSSTVYQNCLSHIQTFCSQTSIDCSIVLQRIVKKSNNFLFNLVTRYPLHTFCNRSFLHDFLKIHATMYKFFKQLFQ